MDLHTEVLPEIFPGVAGAELTLNNDAALDPHALFAVTEIIPVPVNPVPKLTVIDLPVELPEIVAPEGTVHVYDVAFATELTEYTCPVFLQRLVVGPLILPGTAGTELTFNVVAEVFPHALLA